MPWIISVTLTIFVPLVVVYFYVGGKILNALVARKGWERRTTRRRMALLLSVLNLLPVLSLVTFLIGGRNALMYFSGEVFLIDLLLSYPFWFTLIVAVQLFVLFLLLDFGKLVMLSVYRKGSERWLEAERRIALYLLPAVALYSAVVVVKDTWTVRAANYSITLPPGFGALDGLQIALIADVQGDGRTTERRLRSFVEKVNAAEPDFVLFAGDAVTSGQKYIESTTRILAGLRARYGVYGVVGDHDIFSNKSLVLRGLRDGGMVVLEDTSVTIRIASSKIVLTGVTYTYPRRPSVEELESAVDQEERGYKVFLVHQPAELLVRYAEERGYHLFAAGHTHGGGVCFGIPGVFLGSPALFESRFVSGHYDLGELKVVVTNGLGFTLAPVRFHAPAEITLITLRQ